MTLDKQEFPAAEMWDRIAEWLNSHPLTWGGILAFLLALMRMRGRHAPWISTLFEALTCSLLSIGICGGLSSLLPSITPQSCVGIGSLVGYLGTDFLKRFITSFISSRSGFSLKDSREDSNEDK